MRIIIIVVLLCAVAYLGYSLYGRAPYDSAKKVIDKAPTVEIKIK